MIFLDEAIVELISGCGGSGALSFRREKHVPRGGPNGADGGKGGDVILVADPHKRTLYDFKLKNKFVASSGGDAIGNKQGRDGENITIQVPVGTVVYDHETNEPLVDLAAPGMSFVICKGGRGGFGNLHYVSSVRQTPTLAEKGEPGEALVVRLELKLLADVGLVGLPNAGKSTFLSVVSAARPKIADYPFTTITPNLGVAYVDDKSFVVADLPGLIEGASQGVGLGFQFLRHIERTRVLVHLVDALPMDGSDPYTNYLLIEKEIQTYSEVLYQKPRIVAVNKVDLVPPQELETLLQRFKEQHLDVHSISCVTGQGVQALLYHILEVLEKQEQKIQIIVPPALHLKRPEEEDHWEVLQEGEGNFRITGKKILKMVSMTRLDNYESLCHLYRRLQSLGVVDKLREMGVQEGDTVSIGAYVFSFTEEL
jgi:GTP-binding protein